VETLAGVGHPTRYWHAVEDGRIQCDVCPKECCARCGERCPGVFEARPGTWDARRRPVTLEAE